MKRVTMKEGKGILREIHDRSCNSHAASHTLVGKVFRSEFYWPTALADVKALVCRYTNYQFFGKHTHVLAHNLITIPPAWSFAYWGLGMIGPLTKAPGGFTHMLVAIDTITKRIKYKQITSPSTDRVVDFIINILHGFVLTPLL